MSNGLHPGTAVRLASGVERPENEHGEVDEGVVDGQTPFGDVLVSLPGVGGELFHPTELIPLGEPDPDVSPRFSESGGSGSFAGNF